jgi:aminopeptidase N
MNPKCDVITDRETALLVDPKSPAVREEMNVERIIAHELAHQWFGNLGIFHPMTF